jgi:hypothetical protein
MTIAAGETHLSRSIRRSSNPKQRIGECPAVGPQIAVAAGGVLCAYVGRPAPVTDSH